VDGAPPPHVPDVAPPRSTDELVSHLADHSVTDVDALRRRGFTLRLLMRAQAAGLVEVDIVSGRVAVHPEPPRVAGGSDLAGPPASRGGA
jgi:hypothetical protein